MALGDSNNNNFNNNNSGSINFSQFDESKRDNNYDTLAGNSLASNNFQKSPNDFDRKNQ